MRVLWVTLVVLIVDQVSKLLIVQTMRLEQVIPLVGDWFKLRYTENPGMAFGLNFGPKGLITILSIVATLLIIGYLISVRRTYAPYRFSLAMILGGALGNIVDRVFYGVLFQGEPLFTGRVVDFIFFDLWRGYLPSWIPFLGDTYFPLFPIFNLADTAIVLGVVGILIFQRKLHPPPKADPKADPKAEGTPAAAEPLAQETPAPPPTPAVYETPSSSPEPLAEPRPAPAPEAPRPSEDPGTAGS